jgi:hypothetical protein
MPMTATMQGKPDSATNSDSGPDRMCGVCAHVLSAHDGISARFCTATAAGALTRGCVCPEVR